MVGSGDGAGWLPVTGRPTTLALLWHTVGQGPTVLAAGAGRVGRFFFFFFFFVVFCCCFFFFFFYCFFFFFFVVVFHLFYPIFLFLCLIFWETAGHTEEVLWPRPL